MAEERFLTTEGAERIKKELAELKGSAREEIAHRLRDAISMGDLSENADYHKAKEDQGFLEGRIQELEYLLKSATIVDETDRPKDEVQIGASVTVQEVGDDEYGPETYTLVGAKEADPPTGRISNESPIGRALIGAKVGDVVAVSTPAGEIRLKVLKIK